MAAKTTKSKPQLNKLDDLFGLDGKETQSKLKIQEIPITNLIPFDGHPFRLYEGERLDDMVESVKANGVLVPVITRKNANIESADGEAVEILAGHNRINAAQIAGLETVPAIVLEGISDDEAMVYVVETNLIQRSFSDMTHSEKAAVINMHHSKMFSQGKRNDILEQLKVLENPEIKQAKTDTSVSVESEAESDAGQRTDEKIGVMYSLSRNTIARYLRIHRLIRALKPLLDKGAIPFLAAVEISFFMLENQHQLAECLEDGYKINVSKAIELRKLSKAQTLDMETMKDILAGQTADTENKPRRVKVRGELYDRFFKPEQSAEEVESIVEEALMLYFDSVRGAAK